MGREVEVVESPNSGELRDGQAHRDPALVFAGDLRFAQECQSFSKREITARRLVKERVEPVADGRQLEPGKYRRKGVEVRHHSAPTAMA